MSNDFLRFLHAHAHMLQAKDGCLQTWMLIWATLRAILACERPRRLALRACDTLWALISSAGGQQQHRFVCTTTYSQAHGEGGGTLCAGQPLQAAIGNLLCHILDQHLAVMSTNQGTPITCIMLLLEHRLLRSGIPIRGHQSHEE